MTQVKDTRCPAGSIVMGLNCVGYLVRASVVKWVGNSSYMLIENGLKHAEVSRANKWHKYDEQVFNELKDLERSENEICMKRTNAWLNYLRKLDKEALSE